MGMFVVFLFLFTGCYPTRAFWGHVHSSWCNLSPCEYPGKWNCAFFYMFFSAHLLSTFTIQVISHSSREDFKAVFMLRENKTEANWMWSHCFVMMCKNIFNFYSSDRGLGVTKDITWAADLLPWCLSEVHASLHSVSPLLCRRIRFQPYKSHLFGSRKHIAQNCWWRKTKQ